MADDKKFKITETAQKSALNIFKAVYKEKDFGNGRFVRNLLEQAIARQAVRIIALEEDKIAREELFRLEAEDFDVNVAKTYKSSNQIGFLGGNVT